MKELRTVIVFCLILQTGLLLSSCREEEKRAEGKTNISVLAKATMEARGRPWEMDQLNDNLIPDSIPQEMRRWLSRPDRPNHPRRLDVQRFYYEWEVAVPVDEVNVFWYNYDDNFKLPHSYRFKYWDGDKFLPVEDASGLGIVNDQFNNTSFKAVTTTRLMLEIDSVEPFLPLLLEWQVFRTEGSGTMAPVVHAGGDRDVMTGGKTYLSGEIKAVDPLTKIKWTADGPGKVKFADAGSPVTTATFSKKGEYVLTLSACSGSEKSSSSLVVKACNAPADKRLDVVYTKRYKIDNPLWNDRARVIITSWIPHCITQIERTDLKEGEGGLDNFIEAAKALRGEPHGRHLGYVFSNAWVHQTVESICIALMVDPQGDEEIIASQEKMQKTLDKWIPVILAAQEPDGYLQTAYTLRDTSRWKERWAPETRGNHEGYVAGYFIESAINHYTLTEGKDTRLYDAAKKLADCWVANIGPGKKEWYDGHQEMEQALVRFGRFVNDMEGGGRGDSYIELAKYLLDNRKDGSEYDQSHVPVQQQYEAVGHAVRAVYSYSAMADVAAETGDTDYQSAVMSLWDNMVNKKYYVTGGVGSGETSEGFGDNYSLGNDAYCESCSSCGLIFFQYKMNLAYHDARYADLYEETMYNALLGSLDYQGTHFFYTNPPASSETRTSWHVCPCCVGNIPRTLLMIPTWTYVKSDDGIYINLFIGSTINVEKVAGTNVQMVQQTDYPWNGRVAVTVNPDEPKEFAVYIRVPDRHTSELYKSLPEINTIRSLTVNGQPVPMDPVKGYVQISKQWKKGDRIEFEVPMEVQQITADDRIEADRGRIAFRYGPLIYNVETADQPDIEQPLGDDPVEAMWNNDMFGGIITLKGTWTDGSPMLAIPNYLRLNREIVPDKQPDIQPWWNRKPTSIVWIEKEK